MFSLARLISYLGDFSAGKADYLLTVVFSCFYCCCAFVFVEKARKNPTVWCAIIKNRRPFPVFFLTQVITFPEVMCCLLLVWRIRFVGFSPSKDTEQVSVELLCTEYILMGDFQGEK